jgi:uncharacterized protein (TIGR02996 family)
MARNPELEATILASNDPQAYLVYADWLQSQGDPRGELAVLQHRGSDDEAKALIEKHGAAFLGEFAAGTPFETFDLTWRCGFIEKATIAWELFSPIDDDDPAEAQLQRFLELESARFVEDLYLGPCPGEDELDNGVLAAAIEAVVPPNLRRLYLGDTSDWDISGTQTRIPANDAIRGLRELTLRGGSVDLGDGIDLPELRSFTVESGSLGERSLRAIATANWPKLEALEIWFGDPNYGQKGGVAEIAPILEARGLSALRRVALRNCPFADELVTALIASPLLRQAQTLDLSMGNLSDAGMRLMLDHEDAFAHLESLNVDDNALTQAHWPAARDLAKHVTFGNRHDPDRAVPRPEGSSRYRRYVSVGE